MRIVELNIRHGGGVRIPTILDHLLAHRADVIVLTEYRDNPSGRQLLESLAAQGYSHSAHASPPIGQNTVAIVSRAPLTDVAAPLPEGPHRHRVLEATIDGVVLGAVYFPLTRLKVEFWRQLFLPYAQSRLDKPQLLVGDWNTGRHFIDETGATFFGATEFEELMRMGWTDAWRSLHPIERGFSWYSSHGNGFRLDHAFLSPQLVSRLVDATLSHVERTGGATDHSALVVNLSSARS